MPEMPSATNAEVNLCANNNPQYDDYDPTRAVAKQYGAMVSHDPNATKPLLTPKQADVLEAGIEQTYGIDVILPTKRATEGIFTYKAALHGNEQDQQVRSYMLQATAGALSLYSTQAVRDSSMDRLVLTPSLTAPAMINRQTEGTEIIGGSFEGNTAYVNFGQTEPEYKRAEPRVFHETAHAIEVSVMCDSSDFEVDEKFAGNTMYLHYGMTADDLDQSLFEPTANRQFYSHHSAENVMEDRATALTSAVYGRGRIQAGDPDYSSEFRRKQEEVIVRFDNVMPGFNSMVDVRTPYLRDVPQNELRKIQ